MSRQLIEPALRELKLAMKADPLSPIPLLYRAHVLLRAASKVRAIGVDSGGRMAA